MERLHEKGNAMGMHIRQGPLEVTYYDPRRNGSVEKCFEGLRSRYPGLQLVIAVLGRRGITYGMAPGFHHTQCITSLLWSPLNGP